MKRGLAIRQGPLIQVKALSGAMRIVLCGLVQTEPDGLGRNPEAPVRGGFPLFATEN